MKEFFEKIIKSRPVQNAMALILVLYLKFTYFTSKWHYIYEDPEMEGNLEDKYDSALFVFWHSNIVYGIKTLLECKKICALVSPHRDGEIITKMAYYFRHRTIKGSTNKNPTGAVRAIMQELSKGHRVTITPDGPRGPAMEINSNITKIANKYAKYLIPLSCAPSKCFELNSWDKMMVPKPFSKIVVFIGKNVELSGDEQIDKEALKNAIDEAGHQAAIGLDT